MIKTYKYKFLDYLLKSVISGICRLPLSVNLKIGYIQGIIIYYLSKKLNLIAVSNIKKCFPHQSDKWVNEQVKASIIDNSKTLLESYWFWTHPDQVDMYLGNIYSKTPINELLYSKNGLIMITPHIGSWEYAGLYASSIVDMLIMYKPPKIKWLHEFFL